MLANIVVDLFRKGGPVMYPILVVAIVAVAVVGERTIWWIRERLKRDPARLEKILAAIENSDFATASQLANGSEDPVVRMIWRRAGRFLMVMDTLVTLAPLLGLLGTVTGIMGSFTSIGTAELAVEKVTGGIGEALIATAAGLGIAILALVPFNYFSSKTAQLQFELETAATNVEVMVNSAKQKGLDTQIFRAANQAPTA
jgi:biopolymer transport protein ExbB